MENIIENKEAIQNKEEEAESLNPQTYFSMGSQETGSIEIDLVSFRQKNQEAKYLTIVIKNPGQNDEQSFAIDNEEAFNALKSFFKQLSWNG